ncbi:MAG: type II toxin-antitoxin system RelE/ParE family toxin [Mariprofundaceae bacterium]|nr:type II toxin-antitoxin system RelE/ParE family toxin [Mariprofundaceae bacterium]
MPCKIVWHRESVLDQQRLFQHLNSVNPAAAAKAAVLIRQGAQSLLEWPNPCLPMDDGSSRRELIIQFGSGAYVLRYVLDGEVITILRVCYFKELQA